MPSVTVAIHADAAVTQSGLGAGLGPHLPVGTWSGTRYRSAVRFLSPSGFTTWTKITKATLTFWVSDHQHVGPAASDIYVRRQDMANIWSAGEGSQNCNSGFSGSNTTQWDDILPTSTNQASFNSGSTANVKKVVTVTAAVEYYRANGSARLVFVFDQFTNSDYTELWSRDKGSYDPSLYIEYETLTVPAAPVLVSPADNAIDQPLTPTFSWTPDLSDGAQTGADVDLFEDAGPTHIGTQHVTGAATSLTWPTPLNPATGVRYSWKVRTSNAQGTGAYSASRYFNIPALPTVNIDSVRQMVFDPVARAPRLHIKATANFPFTEKRIQTDVPVYDSGWLPDTVVDQVLPVALTNGTAINVTVSVRAGAAGSTATDTQAWTPRWGLTTHRRDLIAAPNAWQSAVAVTTIPPGADLKMEYGSNTTAAAAPTAWADDIADVPLAQWVYWRAWFLPSATAGPTLDKVTILSQQGAIAALDKWSTTRGGSGLAAPWSVDTAEYVYGSRSAKCSVSGAGPFYLYSAPIVLRANRSYILTGLMKSQGDSGAQIMLVDEAGTVLVGPTGTIQTDILHATTLFYQPDRLDVFRYKTPVYVVGGADITVYVALRAGAVAGSRAYFDAVKLEESTVATAWSPGALGASIVDAGGVQIDASKGGVFRLRGSVDPNTNPRAVIEVGVNGLLFAGDTELASPAAGMLAINGGLIGGKAAIRRVYTAIGAGTWTKPAGLSHIEVEVCGGGGAGGGTAATAAAESASSGGGGGGGYARRIFTAAELTAASYGYSVGDRGASTAGAGGGDGGNSVFTGPSVLTGLGGSGGTLCNGTTSNVIASATIGSFATVSPSDAATVLVSGGAGGAAGVSGGLRIPTGNGGNSGMGGGGGRWGNLAAGNGGGFPGGGGGGSSSAASTGARIAGVGGYGVVVITEFYV